MKGKKKPPRHKRSHHFPDVLCRHGLVLAQCAGCRYPNTTASTETIVNLWNGYRWTW